MTNNNKIVTLCEYDSIDNEPLKKFLEKEKSSEDKNNLQFYFSNSWGEIKPKGYCGAFSINGTTYRILPKIDTEKKEERINSYLVFMFLKAYDIKIKNEDVSNSMRNTKLTIFDVLIDVFCRNLLSELSKGIHRMYVTERDNLRKIKGRWLIREHITRNFLNEKVYCEYDEFSENNKLNKLFLFAAKVLKPQDREIRKKLKQIELALEEVDFEIIDANNFNISFNRMNKRFEESVKMALLLLRHLVPNFTGGRSSSFIFLFEMHKVFEKFIANLFKDLEPKFNNRVVHIQKQKQDIGSDLCIIPDLIIMNGDEAELIIDTKYKVFDMNPTQSDKYQMFAYGMSYNYIDNAKRKVLLLYPEKDGNKVDKLEYNIRGTSENSEVTIHVAKIDVKMQQEKNLDYKEYIVDMKNKLSKITVINELLKEN